MKLTPLQIQQMTQKVFDSLKMQNVIIFKEDEKKVFERAIAAVKEDYQNEANLDRDVNKMLDELEKQHGGEFQRHKMFQLLKQKLAKERKVVL